MRLYVKLLVASGLILISRGAGATTVWRDLALNDKDGVVTIRGMESVDDFNSVRVVFTVGDTTGAKPYIKVLGEGKVVREVRARVIADKYTPAVKKGEPKKDSVELPDAAVDFSSLAVSHIRPFVRRYTDEQQAELMRRWDRLPSAAEHVFTLELRKGDGEFSFYLDGQYVGVQEGDFDEIEMNFPRGDVRSAQAGRIARDERFTPLNLAWSARPGVFSNAVASIKPGLAEIKGIPMKVASGAESADIGQVREMKGSWALECDEQLARTALDGMPESIHFAVEPAFYWRAWLLCAVDPDAGRDPIVTTRMTRYAVSGRGGAIALDSVWLPRDESEPPGKNVRRVGTIRNGDATMPIYLVEVDLNPGDILDLLNAKEDRAASMMRTPYIDIDFMGKPGKQGAQWDKSRKPDNDSVSGVHLFGVTLEKMPLRLHLEQTQPGNIFHNDEKPLLKAVVSATQDNAVGTLAWKISDAEGRNLVTRQRKLRFGAAGEEMNIELDLRTGATGWFGLKLELHAGDGRAMLAHKAAFALLGKDTRKAGYESPFGIWWFGRAHYGSDDLQIAGPMLFKAGMRKTTFGWTKYSESDFAPWKVTLNQIGWRNRPSTTTNRAVAFAEMEAKVAPLVERFPHCNAVTIFHESFNNRLPAILIGEEQEESEEEAEKAREMAVLGNLMAEFFKERYPHIKRLVGNTTHSAAIITALLKHGMKPENIDAIGMETVGQTSMPEKLWGGGLQGIWLGREAARRMGHDLPVDGCYEFTARTERTLGERRQAEFYVRDILISLGYGFERVSPGIIMDTGNSYYNSLWGAGGVCQRYPLMYPKQAYVALATVTKVLDRARFVRKIPTGSQTVYAFEFAREDGKKVTALWTTVGEAEVRVSYPRGAKKELVEMLGASRKVRKSSFDTAVTTSPHYIVGAAGVKAVEVRSRRYRQPPAGFKVLDAMSSDEKWRLTKGDPAMGKSNSEMPFKREGAFDFKEVEDVEKGACLEMALIKQGEMEVLVSEYGFVEAAEAIAVEGRPKEIGFWLRGDSGWGSVVFEIEDAEGRKWRTEGEYHDWPGDLSINFDGWRFVSLPFDDYGDKPNISPTPYWGRKAAIKFPIKLKGVYILLNRKALDPTEMVEVPAVVRMKDIGVVY